MDNNLNELLQHAKLTELVWSIEDLSKEIMATMNMPLFLYENYEQFSPYDIEMNVYNYIDSRNEIDRELNRIINELKTMWEVQ